MHWDPKTQLLMMHHCIYVLCVHHLGLKHLLRKRQSMLSRVPSLSPAVIIAAAAEQ